MTAAAVGLAGCGGGGQTSVDAAGLDAPAGPATVLAEMAARGPWMEDFVWKADAYQPCTGCEHLTVLDISADHYQLGVYARMPGQPATATLACSVRFNFVETAVAGYDPRDRTAVALTIGPNDCGFAQTAVPDTWIFQVVTRDASNAPSYLAYWPGAAASAFPGYDYQSTGTKADPLRPCATAPASLCEPACNLSAVPTGGCGLVEP